MGGDEEDGQNHTPHRSGRILHGLCHQTGTQQEFRPTNQEENSLSRFASIKGA